ncbi:MAG: hypothetical protein L3J52_09660 [Proteobacteria bacterium]|nr:hypothetical protein [Pseudomonadota bacterium]
MIEIIPNLHPIFVHFTVSLLVFTGLLQLLIWFLKEKFNKPTIFAVQKWRIILGTASIIITVATGLQAYYSVGHDTPSHAAMTDHRNWAFITATVFLLGATLYHLIPKSKQVLAGSPGLICSKLEH